MADDDPNPRRWKEHLPAVLILGSPAAAAGLAHAVAMTDFFLLTDAPAATVFAAAALRINFLLGIAGSAAGGLRVGGTVPTRVAVVIASAVFAGAAYLGTIGVAAGLIPGYAERYGPD